MHSQDNAVPTGTPSAGRQCSRCRAIKPSNAFYTNPRSICKDCHNKAARFTGACRRAAIAHLVTAHSAEYYALLAVERQRRQSDANAGSGGGSDAA
jgi:hypothetical protein